MSAYDAPLLSCATATQATNNRAIVVVLGAACSGDEQAGHVGSLEVNKFKISA